MQRIVKIISMIIWIIYFWLLIKREIIRKNKNKDKYTWNILKSNIFYLVRLDNLFFLIMFYIYKGFNNDSVTAYLYFVFMFASLVFILYDLDDKYKIKKIDWSKETKYFIGAGILFVIPIIYYLITKDLANSYMLTFIIDFLVPIIIFGTRVLKIKK